MASRLLTGQLPPTRRKKVEKLDGSHDRITEPPAGFLGDFARMHLRF
jgi:hypothetical protein